MSAPILSQFAILEKRKAAFLLDLKTWTPRQLAFRPPRGGWSALEVLDHVVKTERGITEEMEKNLPDRRRVPALDAVRSRLLIALMNSRLRFKVPIEVSARVWLSLSRIWTLCFRHGPIHSTAFAHGSTAWAMIKSHTRSSAIPPAAGCALSKPSDSWEPMPGTTPSSYTESPGSEDGTSPIGPAAVESRAFRDCPRATGDTPHGLVG